MARHQQRSPEQILEAARVRAALLFPRLRVTLDSLEGLMVSGEMTTEGRQAMITSAVSLVEQLAVIDAVSLAIHQFKLGGT